MLSGDNHEMRRSLTARAAGSKLGYLFSARRQTGKASDFYQKQRLAYHLFQFLLQGLQRTRVHLGDRPLEVLLDKLHLLA